MDLITKKTLQRRRDELRQKQRFMQIAQEVLDGTIGPDIGFKNIWGSWMDRNMEDELYLSISFLEDVFDDIPLGNDRNKYSEEELTEFDIRKAAKIKFYEKDIRETCEQIIARFKPEIDQIDPVADQMNEDEWFWDRFYPDS